MKTNYSKVLLNEPSITGTKGKIRKFELKTKKTGSKTLRAKETLL